MLSTDSLAIIAQLGLGLAGFSGIAIVFTRGGTAFLRFEAYRLGVMLGTTLGATFLALVPLVLVGFGIGPWASIRMASGLMAMLTVVYAAYYLSAIRYMLSAVPELVSPVAVVLVMTGHGANLLAQIGVACGFLGRWSGVYLAGLTWLLIHGAYQFGRILFIRPRIDLPSR